ncbi:GntR family transcriptional regulator [Arthrobacter sp. UYEF20]|uniref:GntR family transcriptional regulator n=1 Tax=Arthrobacter sp. UYEF20 TaxID=1756363 RepID=UPI0033987614
MVVAAAFENESLSEKVKRTIVDRVVDGTYPPGTRLVELQLAKEFGVSQAPVREALRELSSTRLVENIPRRGTFVRSASQDDLAEVYFVRLALEGTAAAAAYPALHADPSPLREALAGMREAATAGTAPASDRGRTQAPRLYRFPDNGTVPGIRSLSGSSVLCTKFTEFSAAPVDLTQLS